MEQSKIVRHIKDLSPKLRERFRHFVQSPYFNQHEQTTQMVDLILDDADKTRSRLGRDKVFKKLFPGQSFDEQKLHKVLSYVKKLYVRFLALEQMDHYPFLEQVLSLEAAYEHNQFDLLNNRARQLKKNLTDHPFRNSHYHFAQFRLNYLLGYYETIHLDRSRTERMQSMLNHLDRYYLAEKLRHCCHLTANMILMNTHYEFHFLESLLLFIGENRELFKEDLAVQLYYIILMTLREENDEAHYTELKEMLAQNVERLSPDEQSDLYLFSYNYCIRQINLGRNEYQRELFTLYRQGLKSELLLTNGMLNEWDYKNITTLGCGLKEFEWTENFIQEYQEKLPANRRENAYNYNMANLFYHKKMYGEALSHLLHVQFTDVKYHLNTSFLTLRTYYAMGDTEALLGLIDTFRIYVIRNRNITAEQKKGLTNFLRFCRRLVLLKHQDYTYSLKALHEKLQKLHTQILQTENVMNKQWLLEESALEAESLA